MMRLLFVGCLLPFLLSTPSAAQTRAPAKLDSRAQHISVAIDLLSNIKRAVVQSRKGNENAAYKAIGIRFAQCAILYGVLSKGLSPDQATLYEYQNAMQVLSLASGFLYPDGPESYKRDVSQAQTEIMTMVESKDKKKTFYIVRNCQDFWKAETQTVANAIAELML